MHGLITVNNKFKIAMKINLVSKFVVFALLLNYSRINETKDAIFQNTIRTSK